MGSGSKTLTNFSPLPLLFPSVVKFSQFYYTVCLEPNACGSVRTSNGWLSLLARLHRAPRAHDPPRRLSPGPHAPIYRVTSPSPGSCPMLTPWPSTPDGSARSLTTSFTSPSFRPGPAPAP